MLEIVKRAQSVYSSIKAPLQLGPIELIEHPMGLHRSQDAHHLAMVRVGENVRMMNVSLLGIGTHG